MSGGIEIDVNEIAKRSPHHALGVSIVTQAQQALERQRRLWQLREKRRLIAAELDALDEEIAVEAQEQERNGELYELTLDQFAALPTSAPVPAASQETE